jgi:isoquinoline 1-oxidoreductase beta subunit
VKRRTVLWLGLGAAGALVAGLAVIPPRRRLTGGADAEDIPETFTPNAWVRIGRDGVITLFMPRAEMGQGTHTGLAMLLAEELACELQDISIAPAPVASVYNNLAVGSAGLPFRADDTSLGKRLAEHFSAKFVREFGFMVTGGSTSIRDLWDVLREAGAMARETLRAAAAAHWQVPASCSRSRSSRSRSRPSGPSSARRRDDSKRRTRSRVERSLPAISSSRTCFTRRSWLRPTATVPT